MRAHCSEQGATERRALLKWKPALLKSLVIGLRADVDEAQRRKAQALPETSAAAIGGLIKAFDDYERSGL
jgi:hypothetical protein